MANLIVPADVPEDLRAPLTDAERGEIERFIMALDREKHSGAEHRAADYLRRLYGRCVVLEQPWRPIAEAGTSTERVLGWNGRSMAVIYWSEFSWNPGHGVWKLDVAGYAAESDDFEPEPTHIAPLPRVSTT
jgi:hypothetical protein